MSLSGGSIPLHIIKEKYIMTKEEKQVIDNMSHEDMARLWRNAPSGHKYFITGTELSDYFCERFLLEFEVCRL